MGSLVEIGREIQARDILLSERYLSKTPFSSIYWVLKRRDDAIAEHAKFAHGTLLDVGCGIKPYERFFKPFVEKYIGLEYSPESGYRGNRADICGDAAELPVAAESVDTILCTEVLVNLPDTEKTIAEFARVLAPGGTVITTAPFVYPVHETNDYFRFSPEGLATIMRRHGLLVEKIHPFSGTAVSLAIMTNLYWYDAVFMWTKWLYPIGLIFRPVLWLMCFAINIIGGLFEVILPDDRLSFNHLTIARKELKNF